MTPGEPDPPADPARPADSVRVTTLVELDPTTAFEVFTTEVDLWWRREPRFRFDDSGRGRTGTLRFEPRVGGRLMEVFEDEAFEVGRVRTWDPAQRLVFTFRDTDFAPDESTEVEVRFEPDERGTRVTLEHRGWDAISPAHPARKGLTGPALDSMIGGRWADLLVALRRRAVAGPR